MKETIELKEELKGLELSSAISPETFEKAEKSSDPYGHLKRSKFRATQRDKLQKMFLEFDARDKDIVFNCINIFKKRFLELKEFDKLMMEKSVYDDLITYRVRTDIEDFLIKDEEIYRKKHFIYLSELENKIEDFKNKIVRGILFHLQSTPDLV